MDYSPILSVFTDNINPNLVLTIFGLVVSSTIGIFLAVWGGKKIINATQSVSNTGNLSLGESKKKFDNLGYFRNYHYRRYGYYASDKELKNRYFPKHYNPDDGWEIGDWK